MTTTTLCNVNRCVGCWTCSMACKTAFDLAEDESRLFVKTIGGDGVDLPGGTWPDLFMKWEPVFKKSCARCSGDASTGNLPYCVYNCTTEALTVGDLDDPDSAISHEIERLRGLGYRIWSMPAWEETRANVVYAEK